MQMLDHVSITVRDLDAARPFYEAVMAVLGVPKVHDRVDAIGFGARNRPGDDGHTYLSVYRSPDAMPDPRRHWCFRASSVTMVHAFFEAGCRAGGRSAGDPGLRPNYHPHYFAAFLEDPEGNRIEAVFHGSAAAIESPHRSVMDKSSREPAIGAVGTAQIVVEARDLASSLSRDEGDVFPDVLATARMVALMETAAARLLKPLLEPGELSVGATVESSHLAATPPGATVTAHARYLGRDGKLYRFEVWAEDPAGEIGRGVHRRAIVGVERLLAGAAKRGSTPAA